MSGALAGPAATGGGLSVSGRSRPRAFEPNPVLVKELRSRFRGPRAFAAVTAFLTLLVLFIGLTYVRDVMPMGQGNMRLGSTNSQIGQMVLGAVAAIEALCMVLVAPSLTAGAIAGEHERLTFDMLRATPLSGSSIVVGKFGSALAYVLLVVFCCLPVMSVAFVFGGIDLATVIGVQVSTMTVGILYLAIGAFWSSMVRRSTQATVLSYVTIGGLCLASVLDFNMGGDIAYQSSAARVAELGMQVVVYSASQFKEIEFFLPHLSMADVALYLSLVVPFRLGVAAILLLAASGRIRPLGRRGQVAFVGIPLGLLIWTAWRLYEEVLRDSVVY